MYTTRVSDEVIRTPLLIRMLSLEYFEFAAVPVFEEDDPDDIELEVVWWDRAAAAAAYGLFPAAAAAEP